MQTIMSELLTSTTQMPLNTLIIRKIQFLFFPLLLYPDSLNPKPQTLLPDSALSQTLLPVEKRIKFPNTLIGLLSLNDSKQQVIFFRFRVLDHRLRPEKGYHGLIITQPYHEANLREVRSSELPACIVVWL